MCWANLTRFMPVLVVITCIIHQSRLHFAVGGSKVYLSNTWVKNFTGIKCQAHTTIYHVKFGGKSHHLKQQGRKTFA